MNILIASDMEGATGVVDWDHVMPERPDYPRFCRLLTGDINAAARGAFAGGAKRVSVTDGHNTSRNILIEELDGRVTLNCGSPMPALSMVHGVDRGVDGVLFIGYHARAGAQNAILDHTWSDARVANLWINDRLFGEAALNAAVCGQFNAPVLMISGDQTACAEARDMLGDLETAIVKTAVGRMAAECLPPSVTAGLIEQAAKRAVERLQSGTAPAPFIVPAPIVMTLEFYKSEMADKAMTLPGARRAQDRKVQYNADDMLTIYHAFRAMVGMAR